MAQKDSILDHTNVEYIYGLNLSKTIYYRF